jgi:hypothetical protein
MENRDDQQAAEDLIDIIGTVARAVPIEQAVAILMCVVTNLIQASPYARSYWDQLAGSVEEYRRRPSQIVGKGSSRVQ